jgi:hypothetical protein
MSERGTMTSSPDGGFFASTAAAQTVLPGEGYGTPPARPAGWAPPAGPTNLASGGGGVPAPSAATGTGEAPAWVVAAATVLALTGLAAGWVGLTIIVALQAVGVAMDGEGVLIRALLLLANGVANGVLAYQLLRGSAVARWAVAGICGWWLLYWLYRTSQMGELTGSVAASPFFSQIGQIGTMATLGLLLLSGLAAATAGVLWTATANRHFAGR